MTSIYDNYDVPMNADIDANMNAAAEYARTHSLAERYIWFYDKVRNNADHHLAWDESWDYKQRGKQYADFGNLNYGATGTALGIPE